MSSKFSELRQQIANVRAVSIYILETVKKKELGENAILLAQDAWIKLNHAKAFLGKANPEVSPYPKWHNGISDLQKNPETDAGNQQVLFDLEKTDDLIVLCDLIRNDIQEVISELAMSIEYSYYSQLCKDALTIARFDYGFIFNEIRKDYAS